MSTSFFEIVKTHNFKEEELPMLPEHTDYYRLSIESSHNPDDIVLTVQLSSTIRQKSGISRIPLSKQEILRTIAALSESLLNLTGIQPPIQRSLFSTTPIQLDLFVGKTG